MNYRDHLTAPLAGGTRRDARWAGGWVNPATGQGSLLDRHTRTEWQPPVELPRHVVDGLLQFSGLLRRLCWREPYDCTREGFDLTTSAGPDASRRIMHRFRRLAAVDNDGQRSGGLQVIARARQWARAYGGALIVGLLDDGRHYREPLDLANLRAFNGVRVLDRHEAHVVRWHGSGSALGRPEVWQCTFAGHATVYVHASRVIQVQGVDLPERLLVQRHGWGGSVLDLVWTAWRNWQSTLEYVPELMTVLTQGVFKQKGLAEMILAKGPDSVIDRYETLRSAMGTLGELAIDADMEDYEIQTRGVAGVGDLLDPLVENFLMETDTPRILLKNETIGGLNTGENSGEIRGWYDFCAGEQLVRYEPPAETLLRWECAARTGPTGGVVPEYEFVWKPLWQPTRAEDDAHDQARATIRQTDTMSSVVTIAEARKDPNLRKTYGELPEITPPASPAVAPLELAANGPALDASPSRQPEPDDSRSPQEIAALYGMPTLTINRLWRSGAIGHWGIDPHVRVSAAEVAAYAYHPAVPPAAE